MDEACALYDGADRLVVCNRAFARGFAADPSFPKPGTKFRDHVQWFLDRGLIADAVGREAAWLRERMRRHRNPKEPIQIHEPDGRWFEIVERKTRDGGTLMLRRNITDLKRREEEVAASEARFRALFENAPVAIVEYDYSATKRRVDRLRAKGVRNLASHLKKHPNALRAIVAAIVPMHVNRHAAQLFGTKTPEEALKILGEDLKAGLYIEAPTDIISFAEGESTAALEGPRRMRDGSQRYLRSRFFLDPAHREDWSRVVSVTEDVTELQALNRRLAENQARWTAFLDNAPMSIGIKDREGRFVEVSEFLATSWGVPRDHLVGKSLADIAPPAVAREIAREDRTVMASRTAIKKYRAWPRIGDVPATETHVVRFATVDAAGTVTGTGFIETDVSEQLRARRTLEQTQARWQAFLDNAPMAIAIKDRQGRYQVVNRFLSRGNGMEPDEVVGKRVHDLANADISRARAVERQERAVARQRRAIVEERYWPGAGKAPPLDTLAVKFPIAGSDGKVLGTGTIEINITEQIRAQRALAASESLFRLVMDSLPAVVWMTDAEGNTTFRNKAWSELTGATPDDVASFRWDDAIHPDDLQRYEALYRRVLKSRIPERVEYRFRGHDGAYRWLLESATPRFDDKRRFQGFVGTCIDVTERKVAEEAARESEERFRAMADGAPVLLWMNDLDHKHIFVNRVWREFSGARVDAELGEGWRSFMHPDDVERVDAAYQAARATWQPYQAEYRWRRHDGQWRWLSETAQPRFDSDGEPLGYIGSCQDVTEMREAEQALRASEERAAAAERRLADAIEHLAPGIAIYDAQERLVLANAQARSIAATIAPWFKPGARFEDLLGRWFESGEVEHEGPVEIARAARLELFRGGQSNFEQRFGERWVRTSERRMSDGGTVTSNVDITELKAQQEALDDSRALLRTALDAVPASINVKNREGRFMLVNSALAKLYGRTPAELEGWHARDVRPSRYAGDRSDDQHDEVVRSGIAILGSETYALRDGTEEVWSTSKVPVRGDDGQVKFVVTTSFDITEMKRAQQAVVDSETRLKDAEERAGLAHWHIDVATGRTVWSESAAAILGAPQSSLPADMPGFLDFVHPDDRARVQAAYETVITEGGQHRVEYRMRNPEGREIWVEERGEVLLGPDGRRTFDLGTIQDISEVKRAQAALQESEARLQEAEERAKLTHWHVNLETGRVAWSESASAILGMDERDLPATNEAFRSLVHPADASWYRAAGADDIARGGPTHHEYRVVRPDGETIWVEEHGYVTLDADGRCIRDVGTLQDITLRKRAEVELRASRAKLTDAQRRAKLAYWEVEGDDRHYVWSEGAEHVLGLDGTPLPHNRDSYIALVAEEDRERVLQTYARARASSEPFLLEYRFVSSSGVQWISEMGGHVSPSQPGAPPLLTGTVQNVTERKAAEEELQRSRARLADAQRRARIVYWELDFGSGRYTWSDEADLVLGRNGEPIPLDDAAYLTIVVPEDRARVAAHYRTTVVDSSPYDIEYRILAEDGRTIWIRELADALRDKTGRALGMVGTVQDVTALKQAEEALRHNEALLRGVMDAVPGAINVKGRDGRYAMVNAFQAKSFSLSPAEFVGKTHFDVGNNRAYDEWLASVEQQVLATGQGTGFFDDPFPDPAAEDGSQRTHWLTSKTPILDEAGHVSHIVGVSIDITARRQAEDEALRRGAALAAVSTAAVRFLAVAEWRDVMDETLAELGDSVGASACYVVTFDETPRGRDARVVSIWVTPGEGPVKGLPKVAAGYTVAVPARWREAWAAGRPVLGLTAEMPADERTALETEGIRSVASLPIFVGPRLWGAITFDQTDRDRVWTFAETDVLRAAASVIGAALSRKDTDDALAESRTALMTVIDALPAYINARDRQRRYTFLNRLEAEWLGVPPEAAIGRTLEEIAPGRVIEGVDTLGLVLETGEPVEAYAEDTTDIDGNPIAWVTTRTPLRRPDGRLEGVITVSVDVSERQKLEEQLRQAQKMEAVGQLTGGIAHDFNNLLAVILGNLELVAEDLPQDAPLRAQVETAIRATLRGSELTHRLLAFARRQPLAPSIVDVNVLVGGMTDLLKRSLGNTITVKTALSDGLWLTEVDYAQLETSILNLAINARDAMAKGGTLVIETANMALGADDPERGEEVTPGDYVVVTVRDNGSGMPPEVLAHVFEPFFTTKGVGKGTGLGLSMVYGFVRQSGGQTLIHSEVGKGTTVRLFLCRARDAASALAFGANIPDGTEGRGETVLVVEDEPAMRELAERVLTDIGYKVVLAEDGPSAMAAIEATPKIDIMLVDVVLSGDMYGTAVATAARERRPGIKVLFMSGYTATAVTQGGLLDPGVNLVPKPFRRAELATKLRQVLAGSG